MKFSRCRGLWEECYRTEVSGTDSIHEIFLDDCSGDETSGYECFEQNFLGKKYIVPNVPDTKVSIVIFWYGCSGLRVMILREWKFHEECFREESSWHESSGTDVLDKKIIGTDVPGMAYRLWILLHLYKSTILLRRALSRGESVRYLIPDKVLEYIERNHLYGCVKSTTFGPDKSTWFIDWRKIREFDEYIRNID